MCAAAHAEQLHPAMVRSSLCVSVHMFSRLPGYQPALTVIAPCMLCVLDRQCVTGRQNRPIALASTTLLCAPLTLWLRHCIHPLLLQLAPCPRPKQSFLANFMSAFTNCRMAVTLTTCRVAVTFVPEVFTWLCAKQNCTSAAGLLTRAWAPQGECCGKLYQSCCTWVQS